MNSASPSHDTLQSVQRPCRTWQPRVLSVRVRALIWGHLPPTPQYLQLPRSTERDMLGRTSGGRGGRTQESTTQSHKSRKRINTWTENQIHARARTHTHTHTHPSPNRHSVCNKANIIYQHFMTTLEEGIPKPLPWSKGWTLEINSR